MKRQALVSLGLWFIYAVAWYFLLQMGGNNIGLLLILAVIPSFSMSEWVWGPLNWKTGSFWSNVWIWIRLWGFSLFWVLLMGLLMAAPLIEMGLTAYGVPPVWLVFVLMYLGLQWQEDARWRKYRSA